MKNLICIFLLIPFLISARAQDVKGSLDQVKRDLCKTWEVNYSMAEGAKIYRAPTGRNLIYTFRPDGTVYFYDNSKTKVKQEWTYDAANGIVNVIENDRPASKVVLLNQNELAILIHPDNSTNENSPVIRVFFKIKK